MPPLLEGFVFGLAIAAPVGPIGLLCIRRTLASGRACGFVSGLGAASADMFYGAVAAFGLTVISSLMLKQQDLFRLAGGLFLSYLGVRTFFAKVAEGQDAVEAATSSGLLAAYTSTLILTLMNPATILSFVAIFSGIDPQRKSTAAAAAMVAGVFLGSSLWWLLLSGGVSLLRSRMSSGKMRWINRISGVCLLGFGVLALAALLRA